MQLLQCYDAFANPFTLRYMVTDTATHGKVSKGADKRRGTANPRATCRELIMVRVEHQWLVDAMQDEGEPSVHRSMSA